MRTLILIASLMICGQVSAENCSIDLTANDAMQFNKKDVNVSASCKNITIALTHTGKLPASTMGHNVVITETPNVQAVAGDGLKAGIKNDYVPQGDVRVIANTKIIGGGEKTEKSFPGNKFKAGGKYSFFCSAPGHYSVMNGTVTVK
jgi:azurin